MFLIHLELKVYLAYLSPIQTCSSLSEIASVPYDCIYTYIIYFIVYTMRIFILQTKIDATEIMNINYFNIIIYIGIGIPLCR